MSALTVGFISLSQSGSQRKLVSYCPCATDGEAEAQQRSSKCCVECATVIARL